MHVRFFVNVAGKAGQREVTVANAESVEDAAQLVARSYPDGIITGWSIVPTVEADEEADEGVTAE